MLSLFLGAICKEGSPSSGKNQAKNLAKNTHIANAKDEFLMYLS